MPKTQQELEANLKLRTDLTNMVNRFLAYNPNVLPNPPATAQTQNQNIGALIKTAQQKVRAAKEAVGEFTFLSLPISPTVVQLIQIQLNFNDLQLASAQKECLELQKFLSASERLLLERNLKPEKIKATNEAVVSIINLVKALATVDPENAALTLPKYNEENHRHANHNLIGSIKNVNGGIYKINPSSFIEKCNAIEILSPRILSNLRRLFSSLRLEPTESPPMVNFLEALNLLSININQDAFDNHFYLNKIKCFFLMEHYSSQLLEFKKNTAPSFVGMHIITMPSHEIVKTCIDDMLALANILSSMNISDFTPENIKAFKASKNQDTSTKNDEQPPIEALNIEAPAISEPDPDPTPYTTMTALTTEVVMSSAKSDLQPQEQEVVIPSTKRDPQPIVTPKIEIRLDQPPKPAPNNTHIKPAITEPNPTPIAESEEEQQQKAQQALEKQTILELRKLCDIYEIELKNIPNKKSKHMQHIVQELRKQLMDTPNVLDSTKLKDFVGVLNQHSKTFSLRNDPETKKFVKHVLKILATVLLSIPTLGLVAAGFAIYGQSKYGEANRFWKEPMTSRKHFVKEAHHIHAKGLTAKSTQHKKK